MEILLLFQIIDWDCTSPFDSSFFSFLHIMNTLSVYWPMCSITQRPREVYIPFFESEPWVFWQPRSVCRKTKAAQFWWLNCACAVHNLQILRWFLIELCFSGWGSKYLACISLLYGHVLSGLMSLHCTAYVHLALGRCPTARCTP